MGNDRGINGYFDKVYVLSLKRDIMRRELTSERLSAVNVDFEFFDACDGQVISPLYKSLNNTVFTTPNYLACAVSHLSIYNSALANGYKRVLILEDDIKPHKDINSLFDYVKVTIPENYDLLYLGWIPLSEDYSMWDYNIIDGRFVDKNLIIPKNMCGLYAYSPSVSLMKELIRVYNAVFPAEIDRYLINNVQQQKKSYAIWPQLFCHDIGISNNNGVFDESSLEKSIDLRGASRHDYL
jgi:hypothetical protein